MNDKTIKEIAMSIVKAEKEVKSIKKISETYENITLEDSYAIQKEVFNIKEENGEKIIGKKIGLTSKGIQEQIGVFEPDFSLITDKNILMPYDSLKMSELINPRLEPEIAFVLKEDLKGPIVSIWDVIRATEGIFPAFEIVDTRFQDYDFTIFDTISDSASYGRIIVGNKMTELEDVDIENIPLSIFKNNELVDTATSAEVMGNPINAVVWLANKMIEMGQYLRKGEVILSGSFTPVLEMEPGDFFEANFGQVGKITLRVEE